MGFYESSKEILARPNNCDVALVGSIDRIISRFGSSTVYLYLVLRVSTAGQQSQNTTPATITISGYLAGIVLIHTRLGQGRSSGLFHDEF